MSAKLRNYVFTCFDTEMVWEWVRQDVFGEFPQRNIKCLCFQLEEAPSTKAPHIQGYAEFTKPLRPAAAKQALGSEELHLEVRRGTREQAMAYASKTESRLEGPWLLGNHQAGQGSRSDLTEVKRLLDERCPDGDIADAHFGTFVRYWRGFNEYKRVKGLAPQRDPEVDPTVFVLWGPTGTGKTRDAAATFPDAYWFMKPTLNSPPWMDGYRGQSVVILDEFYGWLPFDLLLRLLDRYPLQMPVKGSSVQVVAHTFVITSNRPPNEWYKNVIDISPLMRRLTHIWEYQVGGSPLKHK